MKLSKRFLSSVQWFFLRCLTVGLAREGDQAQSEKKKTDKTDEKQFQRYEEIRKKINGMLDDAAELHKCKIQVATEEEVRRIQMHLFDFHLCFLFTDRLR